METRTKKELLYRLLAIGLGALGGFLYWKYVGCAGGQCPITSSPWLSTLWGAALGSFLPGLLRGGCCGSNGCNLN